MVPLRTVLLLTLISVLCGTGVVMACFRRDRELTKDQRKQPTKDHRKLPEGKKSGGKKCGSGKKDDEEVECCVDSDCDDQEVCIDGSCTCFPGDARVEVQGKGFIRMDELKQGDKIRSGSSSVFSEVYAFGHRIKEAEGVYIRLETVSSTSLELSTFHQVFVGEEKYPKYAKDVNIGDSVWLFPSQEMSKVVGIKQVTKKGVYNPTTYDGTLVVNGILASSFPQSPHAKIAGIEILSKHTFKHMAHTPGRFMCRMLPTYFCGEESHTEDGMFHFTIFLNNVLNFLSPGKFLEEGESNFLALSPTLPFNVMFLLLVGLMYAVEIIGFFKILATVAFLYISLNGGTWKKMVSNIKKKIGLV